MNLEYVCILLTCSLFFAGCSKNNNGDSTSTPLKIAHETKSNENSNSDSTCGTNSCNYQNEFCYKVVKGAKLVNIIDCGPNNEYNCTLWVNSYKEYGEIQSQQCLSYLAKGRDLCHSAVASLYQLKTTENDKIFLENFECNRLSVFPNPNVNYTILKSHIKK